MEPQQLSWIANFIWGIADDVLRDLYVRGKYRDVILPMTVLRRLDDVVQVGVEQRQRLGGRGVPGKSQSPQDGGKAKPSDRGQKYS